MRRAALAGIALALVAGGARPGHANGRFPISVSVETRPGSTSDLYLGTTFGLLISHDDGAGFYWLCEQNIGYQGTFDPKYRVAADGTIYATTFEGLRVSRDGGCTFQTATEGTPPTDPGYLAGVWVDALDVGPDGTVWVATAEAGRPNDVYRSTDSAATFTPTGLSSAEIWWKSVVVAPSDARRVYVSGYQVTQVGPDGGSIPPTVHIDRSDDTGGSWVPLPIADFTFGTSPLLLVDLVAPDDPDLVFAHSVRAVAPAGDILYRSIDAGQSWTEVLTTTDAIRDVVMRASGEVLVATQMGGIHHSSDRGQNFSPLPDPPQAACLTDRGDSLFACGANWDPDLFALGRSSDGTAWTKVFRFVEMKGPLSCPGGTVQHDTCEALLWPMIREQFGVPGADGGIDAPGPPPPPGGCCDARAGAAPFAAGLVVIIILLLRGRRRAARHR